MCRNSLSTATSNSTSGLIVKKPPGWIGVRHLQVALLFLCLLFAYIIRVNISVAIVAMTGSPPAHSPTPTGADNIAVNNHEVFDWDSSTKSLILSAFFVGYLVMNVPAAVIGHKFNNKRLLGGSFAVASILSLLTPFLVNWGSSTVIIIVRICQGLSQGFMMPMIHGLLSKWAPPQERARFATYVLGGLNFGTFVVLSCSGVLASSRWGWPSIFYCSGVLGLLWVILWMILGANSPETHRFISAEERDFIKQSLPSTAHDSILEKSSIPWRDILTSAPVWATTLAHLGQNWGIWTILTEVPTFFNKALKLKIEKDGFITAFPFLLMWIVSFPLAFLADFMINKKYTSVTFSRKLWNTVAHWGGAAALLGVAFSEHANVAVLLYTISVTINCCIYMGFNVNHLDLSPNFARILMGITNGTANITAILAPLFVGYVIKDETKVDDWRIVFICSAMAFFLGNLAFITLGSGKLQPWNDPDYNRARNSDTSRDPERENS